MEVGQIRPQDKALEAALEAVRATPGEAQKFAADPAAYLKTKGVATDGLRFGEGEGELSDQALEAVSGGGTTVCVSVGYIICASVGESTPREIEPAQQ